MCFHEQEARETECSGVGMARVAACSHLQPLSLVVVLSASEKNISYGVCGKGVLSLALLRDKMIIPMNRV